MHYHHTQTGYIMLAGIGLVVILFLVISSLQGLPVGAALPAVLLVIGILSLFSTLTVDVGEGRVLCYFGPGLIRKSIPLADIVGVRPVRNPVLLGWGIRWMPGQYWVWNVSGLDAVELTLLSGNRFRIGTDEPLELAKAIEEHRATIVRM